MKSESKSSESRALPTADEQAAALAKLSQKDRDNFERQITTTATKNGEAMAAIWRRLASVGFALAHKPPKLSGVNTIQFFIPDGNYRKQVYAMHLADTGELTLFLPNILPEATKAKLITPIPKDPTPHAYTIAQGGRVIIDPYDRDSPNPQFYFKDMTGWNRKAIGVVIPADASEAVLHLAEQLMLMAVTWPAAVAEPAK